MSLPVIWAPFVKDEYAALLEYVEQHLRLDAALKLLEEIAAFPEMFPASEKRKNIRGAVISKQTSLFYRISQDQVQALYIWDNRREPDNLEYVL